MTISNCLRFQHDHLMGVVAQTKPNGGTQATMAYRPFGEPLAETGTPVGRQRYTGREDDGTGLMYYRARYYDPGFGGFISEDPLKFKAGPNFYAYVDNNPINGNDPSGLRPGDIYGVGPATNNPSFVTRAKDAANLATQSLFVQKPSYIHVATEILPLDGTRRIAEAVPSGVRIVNFGDWVAGERDAGRAVARYAPVTPYDQSQLQVLTRFAESKVGSPYDWTAYLGSKDTYRGEFICSEFCNAAASNALGPRFGQSQRIETPFGNLAVPSMPSQIQESSKYQRIDVLDTYWSPNGSLLSGGGAAGGGFLLYPNKANTNMMRSVYSK